MLDDEHILSLIRKYTPFYQENNHFLEPKDKIDIKNQVSLIYDEIWMHDINLLLKASSFLSYKTNIELEKYTFLIKNQKHRVALSRLRLSSHQLMIEKGRHRKPVIPRLERICPMCNHGVEDECHFVTICPIYHEARNALFSAAEGSATNFEEIPSNEQKFIYLI